VELERRPFDISSSVGERRLAVYSPRVLILWGQFVCAITRAARLSGLRVIVRRAYRLQLSVYSATCASRKNEGVLPSDLRGFRIRHSL